MFIRAGGLALILAAVVAGGARAEEVTFGMLSSVRWDTNAFNDGGKRVNAWRGELGPRVRVERNDPVFNYQGRYQALYERSLDRQATDTWDHLGRLSGNWNLNRRTSIFFSNDLVSQQQPVFFGAGVDPGDVGTPGADETDDELQRTTRNFAQLRLTHQLDRRWAVVAAASHSYIDVSSDRRFDSASVNGQLFTTYAWSRQTQLDLGASASYTSIEGTQLQSGSRTRSFQVFGGIAHSFDPSFRFNVRGGPTIVRTKGKRTDNSGQVVPLFRPAGVPGNGEAYALDSCLERSGSREFGRFLQTDQGRIGVPSCSDRVVSGVNGEPLDQLGVTDDEFTDISGSALDEDTLSFFGEASITKSWRTVTAQLSYRRSETPSTQTGGSTSIDLVSGSIQYNPAGPWLMRFGGNWSLRESLSDIQVNTAEGGLFVESAQDSGLRGLDTQGNVRPIAQAGSLFTSTVSNAVKTIQWSLFFRLQRRLQNNGTVALDIRYRRLNEKGDALGAGTNGQFVAAFRFEYDLDPFEL